MPRATALRILFDKNLPLGVRRYLAPHEVRTVVEMNWPPQLQNGELLRATESAAFVRIRSDRNIRYPQNPAGRKLGLGALGSSIWPVVRNHGAAIAVAVDRSTPGSYHFIEMPLPPRPRNRPK
jgi:hypothetical protein